MVAAASSGGADCLQYPGAHGDDGGWGCHLEAELHAGGSTYGHPNRGTGDGAYPHSYAGAHRYAHAQSHTYAAAFYAHSHSGADCHACSHAGSHTFDAYSYCATPDGDQHAPAAHTNRRTATGTHTPEQPSVRRHDAADAQHR